MSYLMHGILRLSSSTTVAAGIPYENELELTWNFENCLKKYFRVEGTCVSPPNAPGCIEVASCPVSFVVNVLACNAEEVCRILKTRNFVQTIKSIREITQGTNTNCYPDHTPTIDNCEECCDFLVDENVEDVWGGDGFEFPIYYYQSKSSLKLKSFSTFDDAYRRRMNGKLNLSSNSQFNILYVAKSSAKLNLKSYFTVRSSDYRVSMTGRLNLFSDSSVATLTDSFRYQSKSFLNLRKLPSLVLRRQMHGKMVLGSKTASRFAKRVGSSAKIVLSSYSVLTSSSFSLSMHGKLKLNNYSTFDSTEQGTILMDFYGDEEVKNEGVVFSNESAASLSTVIPDRTDIVCCKFPLPTRLELRHNLNSIELFKYFLLRNGFIVPGDISSSGTLTFVPLYYSERVGAYLGQLHYNGHSSNSVGNESWSFSFEFACNDLTNPASSWQFTMLGKVFYPNRQATFRLSATFNISQVCIESPLFFAFIIDTIRLTSIPDAALGLVFHDEDGVIINSVNPQGILRFSISVPEVGATRQTFPWSLDEQLKATLPPLL